MEKLKSIKAGLEQRDSVAHKIGEMLERYQQRLTFDNPRLVERYGKSEIHILVHFRVGEVNENFAACFECASIGRSEIQVHLRDNSLDLEPIPHFLHISPAEGADVCTLELSKCGYQHAMLIDSVKAIDDGKIASLPSIIWFDTEDRVYSVLPQALYFSRSIGFELCG